MPGLDDESGSDEDDLEGRHTNHIEENEEASHWFPYESKIVSKLFSLLNNITDLVSVLDVSSRHAR